ncbi:MAG: CbiX/SirB N-terminal domain-containing protein, partial [Hyphomicrobiales bacterium]
TVIPERLGIAGRARGDRRFVLHSPLGLSDAVTALVARVARVAAREHGVSAPDSTVLLVGHGAKSNGFARDAIEAHARRLTARGYFGRVETAYLEEPPFVADRAALIARPAIAVGMFVSDGLHAGEDVPLILEAATGGPIPYSGAIGAHAGISEIVAAEVLRAEPVAACV